MSEIATIVKLTTAEGKRADALAVLAKLVAAAEDEPGTLQYVMHEDTADADVIWFYERYADQAAMDVHIASSAMAEVVGSLGGLIDGTPEVSHLGIVARKGGAAG
jgi:quinol monooxygenase YgiN